jgi:endonuclease V-like protein UPF0215 family
MSENQTKTEKTSADRIVAAYQEHLEKPELRKSLINNLSVVLDTDEKIENHAKRLGIDPEELKKLLKK